MISTRHPTPVARIRIIRRNLHLGGLSTCVVSCSRGFAAAIVSAIDKQYGFCCCCGFGRIYVPYDDKLDVAIKLAKAVKVFLSPTT